MLDRIFNPENRFWTFANKVADMVVLGFLCLLCCLPLVTIGAALSAFWRLMMELARDTEGHLWSGYFRAFRDSFLTGTAAWLAQLALMGFLLFDALFALRAGSVPGAFLAGLFGALLLLLLLVGVWLYPLIGYWGLGWREAVLDSCLLSIRHLGAGLAGLMLLAAALAACFFVRYAVLVLPVLACYARAKIMNRIFQKYEEPEKEEPPERPAE